MKYTWILPQSAIINSPINKDFNPIFLSLLANRGLKEEAEIQSFINKSLKELHDPDEMLDMDKGVNRIITAVNNKEKILIFGDYDVDGITATSILMQFFKFINMQSFFHIPHRMSEGYGLSKIGIDKAKEKGCSLVITVDTGVSNHHEVLYCNSLGMDIIITDHHKVPENLPEAFAVINPNQSKCPYPNKNIAGAGVAFKLVHSCLRKLKVEENECKKFLKQLIDYVTLGTIADLASLTGENRILVSQGLKQISASAFPGIRIIFDQLAQNNALSAGMIAYRITPKLNASGRVDHGKISAKLLIEENPSECRNLFSQIESFNTERQQIEENDLTIAFEIIEKSGKISKNPIIVISDPRFHPGVNGIIAARIVEKYHLPAIVLAPDESGLLRGSARSIKGVNIYDVLNFCQNICKSFGGHAYAAGCTIESSKLEEFTNKVNEFAALNFSKAAFEPKLHIDAIIDLNQINASFIKNLKTLEPFGIGNSEPVFLTRNAIVSSIPRPLKGKHVKFIVYQYTDTFEVIGFNLLHKVESVLKVNDKIDIVYKIGFNFWLGQEKVQLELIDFNKTSL